MPRLRATLFCVPAGMIPRVARVPVKALGHGKNRAIAAADHEHADPLREGVLDHP